MSEEYKGWEIEIEQDVDAEDPSWEFDFSIVCQYGKKWRNGQDEARNPLEHILWDCDENTAERLVPIKSRQHSRKFTPSFYLSSTQSQIWKAGREFDSKWDDIYRRYIAKAGVTFYEFRINFDRDTATGVAYYTKEAVDKIFKGDMEAASKYIEDSMDMVQEWASGEVYGYAVKAEGFEEDSCWGFYGYDYALQEAKEYIDCAIAQREKENLRNLPTFRVMREFDMQIPGLA